MSTYNSYLDSKNYLNMQGIAELKSASKKNPEAATQEVSRQFESMLVQMLLQSMRNANKALTDHESTDSSAEMYQDLFDKQIALNTSIDGLGLAKKIEHDLGMTEQPLPFDPPVIDTVNTETLAAAPLQQQSLQAEEQSRIDPADAGTFVKNLWAHAKKAALELGVDPKLLVAQAALETGWGKKIIAWGEKGSSHNLFNIKADGRWEKDSVLTHTLEEKDGIIAKEQAAFRAYSSYADSFDDYVSFIKSNPRYQHALSEASDADQYMRALQQANYASDSNYSSKVLEIYKGDRLNHIFEQAELV